MNNTYSDSYSDTEAHEMTAEDRAFDLTVRKMKTKLFPQQLPKHVSEMSKFVDHFESNVDSSILAGANSWKFKI